MSLPSSAVSQDLADDVREAVAGTGVESASSPVVTTSGSEAILVQTEPLEGDESDDRRRRDPRDDRRVAGRPLADRARRELGCPGRAALADRPARLPGAGGAVHLGVLPRVEDVGGGPRRAGARRRDHGGHLRPVGVRGDAGDGHRHADHPRLLALRHRRGVRQGAREHQGDAGDPARATPRQPTSPSTRPWCARSTPRSSPCIPVGAILYVGTVQLGSGNLKDLALALFVGMAVGAYSSIFIATPLVVDMKSGETDVKLAAGARRPVSVRWPTRTPRSRPEAPASRWAAGADPVADEPSAAPAAPAPSRPAGKAPAAGRGRVAPPAHGPVNPSRASGRSQPSRQSRSKRGKK